jgi:hypothetical protein
MNMYSDRHAVTLFCLAGSPVLSACFLGMSGYKSLPLRLAKKMIFLPDEKITSGFYRVSSLN